MSDGSTPVYLPTVEGLAREIITVLDAQRVYFTSRKTEDLIASKRLERSLRERAEGVLKRACQPLPSPTH